MTTKDPRAGNTRRRLLASSSSISEDTLIENSDSTNSTSSSSSRVHDRRMDDYGLLICINGGKVELSLTKDFNYKEIHPHLYAPRVMENMRILAGGGSGVSVFGGYHPHLGGLVMKHGGYKDMNELFALATIHSELQKRGSWGFEEAAEDMQRRLPEFRMIYISPNHIMDRGQELWTKLKGILKTWSTTELSELKSSKTVQDDQVPKGSKCWRVGMSIRIYEGCQDQLEFLLDTDYKTKPALALFLPHNRIDVIDPKTIQIEGDSFNVLETVVRELLPIMTDRLFKFSLGQKTIGGLSPKTGNQWLYEGKLAGKVLENLISQFIQVIRRLQQLTLPDEVDVVDTIRDEIASLENDEYNVRASDLSDTADMFVGNCIKKNFHPTKGRNKLLRDMCKKFRTESLCLTPEEVLPTKLLADLLKPGALMSDTFVGTPMESTILQPHSHYWRNILRRAVQRGPGTCEVALERVWTCGLADAGIHNLFLSDDDLYFFDLGEPQLQSLPGFLTKFLFSFFHTLGMQDDGKGGGRVRRFDIMGDGMLALTNETKELLPKAYDAFEVCLDRLTEEIFEGDDGLRWILLQYVTLQLLSDTAFCLQRWEMKGGGRSRNENHQTGLEKWLWRAIWDVYIAFDINTQESWLRFDVEHPHFRDSHSTEFLSVRELEDMMGDSIVGSGASVIRNTLRFSERDNDMVQRTLKELEGKAMA